MRVVWYHTIVRHLRDFFCVVMLLPHVTRGSCGGKDRQNGKRHPCDGDTQQQQQTRTTPTLSAESTSQSSICNLILQYYSSRWCQRNNNKCCLSQKTSVVYLPWPCLPTINTIIVPTGTTPVLDVSQIFGSRFVRFWHLYC
jgi:hypothetical protein